MTDLMTTGAYGTLSEPATLTIKRRLPGPIERVWAYLTESELRRKWLAAGEMEMKVGAEFEFVWRNNELTDPPGKMPEGVTGEHRMESKITELDPPHKISFSWGRSGGVTIELKEQDEDVLLTLTHHRAPDRSTLLSVSTGWHTHLDVLVARLSGQEPAPFWDSIARNRTVYEKIVPAE